MVKDGHDSLIESQEDEEKKQGTPEDGATSNKKQGTSEEDAVGGDPLGTFMEDKKKRTPITDDELDLHRYLFDNKKRALIEEEEREELPGPLIDAMAFGNDFPYKCHCLARWHGLREFVVIQPASASDAILQDSKANILLSSVAMAVNNANCRLPVFVQTQEFRKRYYLGCCSSPGVRVNYQMIHLQRIPQQYRHLSGLLDIFKEKITQFNSSIPVPPVTLSLKNTYSFDMVSISQGFWPQAMPDLEIGGEDSVGSQDFSVLPFGPIEETVSHLILSTIWPCLSEHLVTETETYSDLDPLQAPCWSAKAVLVDDPACLLSESLRLFVDACSSAATTEQLLSPDLIPSPSKDKDMARALHQVVNPSSPIEEVVSRMSKAVTMQANQLTMRHLMLPDAPLPTSLVNRILWFLFPDARPLDYNICKGDWEDVAKLSWEKFEDFGSLMKASPLFDSLTHRLALVIATVNYGYKGGLPGIAFIWQEFCMELRYRWENSLPIPLIEKGIPKLECCLLYQKLQLLNCCLEKKKTREAQEEEADKLKERSVDPNDDSDDDFFECSESLDEYSFASTPASTSQSRGATPEGRSRPCGNLTLLKKPQESLYIPLTQDPAPMTEDMLQEHAEVLTQLGSGPEGAHLRAQMQSASLLSDMEAFKAANPGCELEDFVRWYSPRDFVVEEGAAEGALSTRMLVEGNIWLDTWTQARAVPAKRQRRLFDDTREAEKVLHYLANLRPGEACRLLLPCLLQAAVVEVHERAADVQGDIPELAGLLNTATQRAVAASRTCFDMSAVDDTFAVDVAEEVTQLISAAEKTIARAQSLRCKLSGDEALADPEAKKEIDRFVFQLLVKPEVVVPGAGRGHVGRALQKLLKDIADGGDEPPATRATQVLLFPRPGAKEYIFRVQVPRPSIVSRVLPQRMFAVLQESPSEFRIAAAFAQDTIYC